MYQVLSAEQLLQNRRRWTRQIKELSAPDLPHWDELYGALITQTAYYYQRLPNSADRNKTLLVQALEDAVTTLQNFKRQHRQQPFRRPNNTMYWAAAAALYFNFNAPLDQIETMLDPKNSSQVWNPLEQMSMGAPGTWYQFKLRKRGQNARTAICKLAYDRLPPAAKAWLNSDHQIMRHWFMALNGDTRSCLSSLLHHLRGSEYRESGTLLNDFIQWIDGRIHSGEINLRHHSIHRIQEGIFVETPRSLEEFSFFEKNLLLVEISESRLCIPVPSGNELQWTYSTKHQRYVNGYVLDPIAFSLHAEIHNSTHLIGPKRGGHEI